MEEEVYMKIAPMKPRLLSFWELQADLRNLAKEARKFQSLSKPKKTFAQVQVTWEYRNMKTEGARHTSDWSELTELVKKLALCQEEQVARLTHLESRIVAPSAIPPPGVRPLLEPRPRPQLSGVTGVGSKGT